MSSDETYRTFIAIELPPDIRHRITEHIDQLRTAFPQVRASWSRAHNLHLTLKFLGDIPVSRIPALSDACDEAARQVAPFELLVKGSGTFPPHGKPKVLWIGIEDAAASAGGRNSLLSLHAALEDRSAAAGLARESRAYHPHLTIARLREAKDSRPLAEQHKQIDFPPQTFAVTEIVLFRSELSSQGSKHTALARHPLGDIRARN
jgi:2'-5' RNA ligase